MLAKVDCVLIDAPCSGSGTLRRQPHNRPKLTTEELDKTTETQKEILEQTSKLVTSGGRLVYATCSVLPSENEAQVQHFLQNHSDFQLEPIDSWWPEEADRFGSQGYLRAAPSTHGTDGFFVARLRRIT